MAEMSHVDSSALVFRPALQRITEVGQIQGISGSCSVQRRSLGVHLRLIDDQLLAGFSMLAT